MEQQRLQAARKAGVGGRTAAAAAAEPKSAEDVKVATQIQGLMAAGKYAQAEKLRKKTKAADGQ